MGDCITDFRLKTVSPTDYMLDGFVAEVRPSSRHVTSIASLPYPSHTGKRAEYMDMKCKKDAEDDLETALNTFNNSFSPELLTTKLNDMIIQLINTLLKGHSISKINGSIDVSFGVTGQTITVDVNENYQCVKGTGCVLDVVNGFKIKKKENETASPLRSPVSDGRPCSGDFGFCSPPLSTHEKSPQGSSPGVLEENELRTAISRQKAGDLDQVDSEEESGYSGSERESVSDAGGEDTSDIPHCDLTHNELYNFERDGVENQAPTDYESVECEEKELVIDLTVPSEVCRKATISDEPFEDACSMPEETEEKVEKSSAGILNADKVSGCAKDCKTEIQSSDGFDAPMDLSGDCLVAGKTKSAYETDAKRTQVKSSELTCKICSVPLLDSAECQGHVLQSHQLYACSICHKDFSSKNNLKRHVRIHTGSRPYKCGQCEMSFARKDDLKGHTLKHDYSKPYRCSLCKKGYTDRACVKNHMMRAHRSQLLHICPECGESFDRDDAYLEHKKSHPSLKQFACKTCPFVGTNHLMAMKHQLLHRHKLFSCKPCNAYFADPFAYTKHIRVHKKTAEYTTYVCCFCDLILPTYDQFVRHEYSHLQGKLHECNTCKKQFRNKTLMLEHSLVHTKPEVPKQDGAAPGKDFCTRPSMEDQESETRRKSTESPVLGAKAGIFGEKIDHEEPFEGELLDLSMKPSVASHHKPAERASMDDVSSQGSWSLSNNCVPRNGCAAIEAYLSKTGESTMDIQLTHSVKGCSDEQDYQVVWKSYQDQDIGNKYDHLQPHSAEILNDQSDKICSRQHNISPFFHQLDKRNPRFHPYSKMTELFSKFIAARGGINKSHLVNEMKSTTARKNSVAENSDFDVLYMNQSIQEKISNNKITSEASTRRTSRETSPVDALAQNPILGLSGKPYTALENFGVHKTSKYNLAVKREIPDFSSSSDFHSFPKQQQQQQPLGHKSRAVISHPLNPSADPAPQVCDICHASFESFFQLESHSVVNHNRYLCEFCGKAFTARPNRDRHVRYHTGERPYKCDQCPCAFFRGDDLKYHRTTRHPTEQISCNRCSASFTWPKDLERHLRHSKCSV